MGSSRVDICAEEKRAAEMAHFKMPEPEQLLKKVCQGRAKGQKMPGPKWNKKESRWGK